MRVVVEILLTKNKIGNVKSFLLFYDFEAH
jgi:hypothetical protein